MRLLSSCLLCVLTAVACSDPADVTASGAVPFSVQRPHAVLHGKHMGHGPPLVLVHGGADHRIFHPTLDLLRDEFTVVFYDQRGYGATEVADDAAPTTIATDLADLEAIRTKFGWDKINVLAYSHGGPIGIEYARTHPERLRKLILLDTYSDNEARMMLAQEPARAIVYDEGRLEQIKALEPLNLSPEERKIREFQIAPHFFHERELKRADVEFWLKSKCIDSGDKRWRSPRNQVLTPLLAEITTDTLVLCGELDRITPLSHSREMAKRLPNGRLHILSGCGHLCYADDPDRFLRTVREFLR